ncbi:LysE family translocator [Donghicola sp. C2-DW-16]|uniref:LysE family translocator n=1 Tax=Donghicola mangrovi TaxID=2729614 RepID=A0ABX2PGW0_9RHOB|nr:LysE family translocator [Donghicola mangrovi]NVO28740.1 LysE family translocator [Donghicola mangrovi]
MTGTQLALFVLGWMLMVGSPGPATLGIMGTAMRSGRRQAVTFATGILTGSAFWSTVAILGLGALMQAHVWIFQTMKYIGAAYLLFLALKSLRSAIKPAAEIKAKVADGALHKIYLKGLLIHLTNPKAVLAWGSVFALVLPPDAPLGDLFHLQGVLMGASAFVLYVYAVLFSSAGAIRVYERARRGFELTFAALFGAASLKILMVAS